MNWLDNLRSISLESWGFITIFIILVSVILLYIWRNFELTEITPAPPWIKLHKKQAIAESNILHNLPQPDYGKFIGREKEIAQITGLLRPYPYSQHALITIDGVGGIGKTALALEVAHRYLRNIHHISRKERFAAIVWVSAKQSVLTSDGLVPRGKVLHNLRDIYSACFNILERNNPGQTPTENEPEFLRGMLARQRVLLIVDNLETVDDLEVYSFLRELPAPSKAIVTTRHRIDVAYPIRLVGMDWEDARLLLDQECKKKLVEVDLEKMRLLYDRTGGVPLAIVWSVALIGCGYPVESVLDRLGQPNSDIARFCFEEVIQRIKGKPPYHLLMALSIIQNHAEREALGYITALSIMDLDDGLVELEKLSLINHDEATFWMLPLTRDYVRAELAKDGRYKNQLEHRYQQWVRKVPLKESTKTLHPVIGIDFGTTYSKVAVWDDQRDNAVIIPSATGLNVLPSAVSLNAKGEIIVGNPALNNQLRNPQNTILNIKRNLSAYDSNGKPERQKLGDREYGPQEMAAFILRELKNQAENFLGEPIQDAVISAPAYFSVIQKRMLLDAAYLAGLQVIQLINEPTAAAICFGADKVQDEHRHLYIVYDLGGGTFDVTIVQVSNNFVEVIGTYGDTRLGGIDIDNLITRHIFEKIHQKYGVDLSKDPLIWARILREAESAKRQLSAAEHTIIILPYLTPQIDVDIELTRQEFESLIKDLIQRTLDYLDIALRSVFERYGITKNDIEQVLLVGGSTRIPLVREMIAAHMGIELQDIRADINPDEVIARGACIVAHGISVPENADNNYLSGKKPLEEVHSTTQPELGLIEVTSHALGIMTADNKMIPIIAKDSILPIQVTKKLYLSNDPKKQINLPIFQGDDPDVTKCMFLGEVSIELPEQYKGGSYPFENTFSLSVDELLRVEVYFPLIGLRRSVSLQPSGRAIKDIGEQFTGSAPYWRDGESE
jgi:molecular chaperone DnaK